MRRMERAGQVRCAGHDQGFPMASRPPAPMTVSVFGGPAGDAAAISAPPLLRCCLPVPRLLPSPTRRRANPRQSAPPRARGAPTGRARAAARHAPISDTMRLTSPFRRAGDAHGSRSRKGESSLTAVALPRTASPQVAVVRHALHYNTRLRRPAPRTSGNSLATATSPQVNCRIGGRNWDRTSDPSLVSEAPPLPRPAETGRRPGHRLDFSPVGRSSARFAVVAASQIPPNGSRE
jgi:hypothetical protein